MPSKLDELRRDTRIPVRLRVDFRQHDNFLFEYTENLSNSGIFIITPTPLPPGTMLELVFHPDQPSAPIEIRGEVIWINPPEQSTKPGMGVKFIDVPRKTKETITRLVNRLAVL
ncbi:MAG: hypothetical protein A2284_08160 [Deltaproteobacteria bacterium RIFOXYA12_FULL_61_11]|nr:MAG: hypothetical protein A2284_08160 [Deltaproteobacteria bacterium RIFOXYA12_FULL_61_11]